VIPKTWRGKAAAKIRNPKRIRMTKIRKSKKIAYKKHNFHE